MSTPFDPWATLGVPRDADLAEIRAAWKRIARETHPDRNPGDPESERRFKDASAAWSVLSDPDQRERMRHGAAAPRHTVPHGDLRAFAHEVREALDEIGEVLFRRVLPSYIARYDRGLGAELCWTLLRDIDTLSLLDLPQQAGTPSFGARSRADELLRRLRVRLDLRARLDPAGEPILADLTLVSERGLQWAAITVWVGSLHLAGHRDPDAVRIKLLPAIAREIVRALEAGLPEDLRVLRWREQTGAPGFPGPMAVARRRDALDITLRVARIGTIALLLALAAWGIGWAWTGRPLLW